jgi:glutamyl-tRNA synthetase
MKINMKQITMLKHVLEYKTPVITRFAPTPSGYLHLGNIYNLLLCYLIVVRSKGKLFLRIDDMDKERTRNVYIEDIFNQLSWLGIEDYHQLNHQHDYYETLMDLIKQKPELFYACDCTRQNIKKRTNLYYDGHCQNKKITFKVGKNVLRFKHDNPIYNQVLWQKNNQASYHFINIIQDLAMGVNLIIRGEDLKESTQFQIIFSQQFKSTKSFSQINFLHHPLLLDEFQNKLSKSQNASPFKLLIEQDKDQTDIYNDFLAWLGLEHKLGHFSEFKTYITSL